MTKRAVTPLYPEEAEVGVLAACLIGGIPAIRLVHEILGTEGGFFDARHVVIWRAFLTLAERESPVDHVTIRHELGSAGHLAVAGGLEYVADLVDAVPTDANAAYHARIVADQAVRRKLVSEASRAIALAHDLTEDVGITLPGVVDALVNAAAPSTRPPRLSPTFEFNHILTDIESQVALGDHVRGLPTGLPDLDRILDGLCPGRLIVVAARPGMGKTAFGVQCAEVAAERTEAGVYFATAEQPSIELQKRRLAREVGTDLRQIRHEAHLTRWTGALCAATAELARRSYHIDQDSLTPAAIRLGVQRKQAEWGGILKLVVVDYLGLYRSGRKTERHDLEIGEITRACARMAIDLNVAVLLLAQLSRNSVRDGKPRRPTLADLRDSGNIEQDAGQVVFLYDEEGNPEWGDQKVELIVAKNRYGPKGHVDVCFDRATGRWWGWDGYRAPKPEPRLAVAR